MNFKVCVLASPADVFYTDIVTDAQNEDEAIKNVETLLSSSAHKIDWTLAKKPIETGFDLKCFVTAVTPER